MGLGVMRSSTSLLFVRVGGDGMSMELGLRRMGAFQPITTIQVGTA